MLGAFARTLGVVVGVGVGMGEALGEDDPVPGPCTSETYRAEPNLVENLDTCARHCPAVVADTNGDCDGAVGVLQRRQR